MSELASCVLWYIGLGCKGAKQHLGVKASLPTYEPLYLYAFDALLIAPPGEFPASGFQDFDYNLSGHCLAGV